MPTPIQPTTLFDDLQALANKPRPTPPARLKELAEDHPHLMGLWRDARNVIDRGSEVFCQQPHLRGNRFEAGILDRLEKMLEPQTGDYALCKEALEEVMPPCRNCDCDEWRY